MDASTTFYNLINMIETSKLNYVISKTPFSAQISIKRSFIKNFKEPSDLQTTKMCYKSDIIHGDATTHLKEKLTIALKEKENLEVVLKQERIKSKASESQIQQFREELLEIKNAKNLSNTK